MPFRVRYMCGEAEVDEMDQADSLEQARLMIASKRSDLKSKVDVAMVFRLTESGTEELEESCRLHC